MSSVHRLPGKPFWFCFFTDATGRRRCKSTKTADKRTAIQVCNQLQALNRRAANGTITADRARSVIESAVAEIMEASGAPLESRSIKAHFETWLESVSATKAEKTISRYRGISASLLKFLGTKANRPLATLTSQDIEHFRNSQTRKVSNASANLAVKIIGSALESAVRQGVFNRNPARNVELLKRSVGQERQPFTAAQIRELLAHAEPEWKTAVLVGAYCGLRLGDVTELEWGDLDLIHGELAVRTQKTGRTVIVPLAAPLLAHLLSLPAPHKGPVMPGLAGMPGQTRSNQFRELLVKCGMAEARTHQKRKSGRDARRETSPLSFHSLRHSLVSMLKASGASDAVAMDIAGHESASISRHYTHMPTETKRAAVDKLPDFTGGKNASVGS